MLFQILFFQKIYGNIKKSGNDTQDDNTHDHHIELEEAQIHSDAFWHRIFAVFR